MATLTLEALGISQEEAAERVIQKIADGLLYGEASDEDGYTHRIKGEFTRKLDNAIEAKINATITALADTEIEPRIAALIDGTVLQETNRWGEKVGQPVTFTEYLVQRAEAYMTEPVNYEGKAKAENGGFSWSQRSTRVAYMIDKHLHYSIETAMKQALSEANAAIGKGLNEAVRQAISGLQVQMKTEVKTR